MSNMRHVDIVASFQTNYYISGVAPFGDCLAILAYIPGDEDGEKDFSSTTPLRQVLLYDDYGRSKEFRVSNLVLCRCLFAV